VSAPERGSGTYRLRPLRDARERDERVTRGDLAAAIGDAASHAAAVELAARRVGAAREALDAAVRASTRQGEASRLALGDRYVARRRSELATAQAEHAHAIAARDAQQGEIDGARTRLTAARAARQVIERHFAGWREARRKAAERRED